LSVKKILFYTNNLNPLFGGALFSQLILMEEFKRRGIEIKIVLNKKRENDLPVNFPIIQLNAKYGDFERPFKLKEIIEKEKPDAVLSSMLPQNVTSSIAKSLYKKNDVKFIGIVRNACSYLDYGSKWKIPYRIFIKKMYENLDYVVGISQDVVDDLKKTFFIKDEKLKIIHVGINPEEVKNKAEEELPEEYREIFKENRILINVGRLELQKNQRVLIDILELVKREVKNVKLVIVGEGYLKENLKEIAKEKNLEKDVIFTGFQENPFKFIKRADLFLLSSLFEGGPRVVKESMILGVPVIAFKTKGMFVDVLSEIDKSLLIPPFDKVSFANKVIDLLKNAEKLKYYQNKSLEKAEEFDIKIYADEYLELIES
jgi:glycosyltransferase involved in cell wall biosynthesis